MEANITEQQHSEDDLQLAEPHFDREATVLSARPVVPLDEVKARAISGKRLAFGLAVVVSLMVGALGAILIYKQLNQKPATAIVEMAVAGSGASTQDPAVAAPSTGEATEDDVAEAEVPDTGVVAEDQKPKAQPQLTRKVESARGPRPKQSISQVDEKELRRADRIDARRLRRKEEREARREARSKSKSPDDLLRIREIFEGSRRP